MAGMDLNSSPSLPPRAPALPWLVGAYLVFLLATTAGYGVFRDELYYVACGAHPAWGYVDHPPLVGWLAWLVSSTLGTSLFALRLLPALVGAATAWLAAEIARRLGGRGLAQGVAAGALALAPISLAQFSYFSMNAIDTLVWALAFWLLVRILVEGEERPWLAFGAVVGVGLLNKISPLFLGFGLVVGLVLAGRWSSFRRPWLWLGGALAALLFLPHVLWQIAHDWPTLEFMDHARRFKMAPQTPASFLKAAWLQAGPLALPLWVAGVVALLWRRATRPLGLAFLAVLVLLITLEGKPYYFGPAFVLAFAAGAVALERVPWRGVRIAALAVLALGALAGAPLAKPLLPVDTYLAYSRALGLEPKSAERKELGRLPQHFADMHGWRELAETVATVYRALPAEDRAKACVFGQNYGQAGAIDYFGPELGLPLALSGHNNYFLWGMRGCSGEVLIVLDDDRASLEPLFADLTLAATFTCKDCMPYESGNEIWVARQPKVDLAVLWPRIKKFT
jgi:hypothetical protein